MCVRRPRGGVDSTSRRPVLRSGPLFRVRVPWFCVLVLAVAKENRFLSTKFPKHPKGGSIGPLRGKTA